MKNHFLDFSRLSKCAENAFGKNFNGGFQTDCLSKTAFCSLQVTRKKIELWRKSYNENRPHGPLVNLTM